MDPKLLENNSNKESNTEYILVFHMVFDMLFEFGCEYSIQSTNLQFRIRILDYINLGFGDMNSSMNKVLGIWDATTYEYIF